MTRRACPARMRDTRTPAPRAAPGRRRQRGLSLVELMVGIAVGLIVVAAALLIVMGQLGDHRRLLLETQLQQDLRAAGDIVARELRRAGAHGQPAALAWFPGSPAARNPYIDVEVDDNASVVFNYRRLDQEGEWGFALDEGAIKSLIGGRWQELTDTSTMEVAAFDIAESEEPGLTLPCPRACSATDLTDTRCWPVARVRSYTVTIRARSPSDASIERVLRSRVRLRNDAIDFNDANAPDRACPR